jgi:hypothetical protein
VTLITPDQVIDYIQRPTVSDAAVRLIVPLVEEEILAHASRPITDPPQPGIRGLALVVAARALAPSEVTSEGADGVQVTYSPIAGRVYLTEHEIKRLGRLLGQSTAYTVSLESSW